MIPILTILTVFGAGMIFESFRLLGLWRMEKEDCVKLFGCISISMVVAPIIGFSDDSAAGAYLYKSFLAFFVMFPCLYLLSFKKKVFPVIDERILMVWSLLFIYMTAEYFGRPYPAGAATAAIIAATAIATPLTANKNLSKGVQAALYVWYIFMGIVFGIMQFDFNSILDGNLLMVFLKGMVSLYLLMCVIQILRMVPISSKHQTHKERMVEWREDIAFMADKFCDRQYKSSQMLLIAAVTTALFAANSYFGAISTPNMISLALALTSAITVNQPAKAQRPGIVAAA